MKRLITILSIYVLACSICFAAEEPKEYMKQINIQGGYETVASIKVTPISAPPQQWRIGMPFSIDDGSVLNGNKRHIANWSVLANQQFKINISAEILHNYTEDTNGKNYYDNGLGYIMEFVYDISYYANSVQFNKSDVSFKVPVPTSATSKYVTVNNIDLLSGVTLEPSTLVGGADGKIYFSFDNATSTQIQNNFSRYTDGNYTARVVIELIVG